VKPDDRRHQDEQFTRGFVKVTKSAHARELEVATAFVLTSLTAFLPIPYSLFIRPSRRPANLAKHAVFHPLLIPPLHGVDGVAVDEHREVEMVAGQPVMPDRSADPSHVSPTSPRTTRGAYSDCTPRPWSMTRQLP
jgi:hypothetical protein